MSADRWDYDPEETPLPKWLIELRDGEGIALEPRNAGQARQQRLAHMERELAECADFIAEADRYAGFLAETPHPCVTPMVPRMMNRYLDELRGRAVSRGRQLREELGILRKAGV